MPVHPPPKTPYFGDTPAFLSLLIPPFFLIPPVSFMTPFLDDVAVVLLWEFVLVRPPSPAVLSLFLTLQHPQALSLPYALFPRKLHPLRCRPAYFFTLVPRSRSQ